MIVIVARLHLSLSIDTVVADMTQDSSLHAFGDWKIIEQSVVYIGIDSLPCRGRGSAHARRS